MDREDLRDYLPEKVEYKKYDGLEAADIVIPTEVNPSFEKKAALRKKSVSFSFLFNKLLDFCESLGEFYIHLFKTVFRPLTAITVFLFRLFKTSASFLGKRAEKLKSKEMRKRISGRRKIEKDIKAIHLMALKQDDEQKSSYFLKSLRKYIIDALPDKSHIIKSCVSYGFPALVLGIIIFCLSFSHGEVFALKIMYNSSTLGYVSSQQTFLQAKKAAEEKLGEKADDIVSSLALSLERVKMTELSSADMISEEILLAGSTSYKRACGIYVDGRFLCATPNESDAASVFQGVLAPYQAKSDKNTTVDFLQEIEYVQEYYPEDSDKIIDSAALLELLTDKKASPVSVKVMKTQTRTQTLNYETVKKNTATLYKGTKKTTQKGKNGKVKITELITYIDSEKSYTSVISRDVITPAVDEIVLVGTKAGYGSSGYAPSKEFIWPTVGAYSVSSHYGYRSASISGWSFHGGIDIVLGYGSSSGIPVVASASGTVVTAYSGWSGYGHTVVIDHGGGIKTRYAHMYPGSITVRPGQWVSQGQQIGRIGSTGNSTGPHLHFEVLVGGYKVNPYPYIR